MSRQFKLTFNYKKVNKTLEIYNTKISLQDSTELIINRYGQFLKKLVFTIDGKALIDNSNNFVYVRYNDFKKKYFLNYLIDDKLYRQETGLPDAYGLIKNNPKNSKILQIKFNSIQDDLKNYTIKIYKGLDAYKKFGYKSVFGVIELKRKK